VGKGDQQEEHAGNQQKGLLAHNDLHPFQP
jgi:hypothetical protein